MTDTAAAIPASQTITLEQRAHLPSFLGLSLKNGLLNLVTLTLYRFWGKTEVRRRVWNTTELNGEPFEYTGRGVELFIGFLLALVVLGLPFLLIVFGAQLLGPLTAFLIILPTYLFLFFLVGFGQFTAFRYLASRTTWRGVRFLLRGSAADYGMKYLGYMLLSGVTMGWFWPAAARRLAAPLWHGLRFGDRVFRFSLDDARKEKVYGAFAIFWVGALVSYFLIMGSAFALIGGMMPEARPDEPPALSLALIGALYLALGVFALVATIFYAPYQAAALRSVAAGISFDDVRLKVRVRWPAMAWLTLSNAVLLVVTFGFLMPFVQARTAQFLISRLEPIGETDLSTVRQSADAGPRHGEGLADAFGLSPI